MCKLAPLYNALGALYYMLQNNITLVNKSTRMQITLSLVQFELGLFKAEFHIPLNSTFCFDEPHGQKKQGGVICSTGDAGVF